mgnify:CR=1 FL=1
MSNGGGQEGRYGEELRGVEGWMKGSRKGSSQAEPAKGEFAPAVLKGSSRLKGD